MGNKKKILFVAPHRYDRCPSQRFRYEQYLDFLEDNGYEYDLSYLITEEDDKYFYKSGNLWKKFKFLVRSWFQRKKDIKKADEYDLILIQREAYFLGTSLIEKGFSNSKAKVIFDFDDAIWLQSTSKANRIFSFLKSPKKTSEVIKNVDFIFAGNSFLADYALKYNKRVEIIPTTVDTEIFKKAERNNHSGKICIGWSGSLTTIEHFKKAIPALKRIKNKYGDEVYFKVIGDPSFSNEELGLIGTPWNSETEVYDLSEIDIGIMPLPNDKWSKGKCGLKGLTYMSLGVPTVMSPVGVNKEIIDHGVNGFLAETEDEWVEILSNLIESSELRKKIGEEGKKTVVNKYSVKAIAPLYLKYFEELLNN